jgi:hypothetical protein
MHVEQQRPNEPCLTTLPWLSFPEIAAARWVSLTAVSCSSCTRSLTAWLAIPAGATLKARGPLGQNLDQPSIWLYCHAICSSSTVLLTEYLSHSHQCYYLTGTSGIKSSLYQANFACIIVELRTLIARISTSLP